MSNERIDDILEETIPFFRENENMNPHYAGLIRKSMQQYGMESSKDGFCAGSDAVHKLLWPEIGRLQALVQAQKEYIELLEPDAVFRSNWTEGIELRKKIKELGS